MVLDPWASSGPSSPWSSPWASPGDTWAPTWPAVFDGRVHFLGLVERPVYRLLGTEPRARADLEALRRLADHLLGRHDGLHLRDPADPGIAPAQPPAPRRRASGAVSFNTAASFVTNTNWQNYGGETTMSYFSQIGALTFQQFISPAVGIAVAIAMVRGFSRRNSADHRELLGRHHPLHALHPGCPSPSSPASSSSARVRCRPWPARSASTTR